MNSLSGVNASGPLMTRLTPASAIAGTRRALERLLPPLSEEATVELTRLIHDAWVSEDAAEARNAFRAKRKPVFQGR